MTADLSIDVDKPDLTDDIETQNEIFLHLFRSGDGEVFDRLYREDAISNFSGSPLTGAERRAFFKELLATHPVLDARVTGAYIAGDVVLVGVLFTLDTTGPDGQPVRLEGHCTDLVRRGDDGRWLMVVDRPVVDRSDRPFTRADP